MANGRSLARLGCVVFWCGCAVVQVGGFTLGKGRWDSDAAVVKKRAAWELKCPEATLELTVLAVYSGTITAEQVGVRGCGQQLVYVNSIDGWKRDQPPP